MDPLVDERPGNIEAITGVSSKNDLDTFDNVYGTEEQEETVEVAGEEESPPVEAAEEDSQEPEKSILQQFYEDQRSGEKESELTRLRQENARLQAQIESRIHAVEEKLRGGGEAPVEEVDTDPLRSPIIRQTLHALREEDPEKYEAALVELATQRAERKLRSELDTLKSKVSQREQSDTVKAQMSAYQQQLLNVFAGIKGQGGLVGEIVSDFETNAKDSLLGKKISENPYILMSVQGIRGAIAEVESDLRANAARKSGVGQVSGREASAGGGKASRRGISLNEKPQEKSFEELVIEDIENIGTPTQKLFGGH